MSAFVSKHDGFEPVAHGCVIRLWSESIGSKKTFLGFELASAIVNADRTKRLPEEWAVSGVECFCLIPSGEWKRGRVRISFEFKLESEGDEKPQLAEPEPDSAVEGGGI